MARRKRSGYTATSTAGTYPLADTYTIQPTRDKSSLTRFETDWEGLKRMMAVDLEGNPGSFREDWAGGTTRDISRLLSDGDRAGVEDAEKLLQEINTQIDVEDLGLVQGFSPMGSSVSIGHYLAGQPACMRRMVEAESDHCPIRVFVGLACSGGNSVDVQRKRGVACVALAMALSRIRPVELWGFSAVRPTASCVAETHKQDGIDVCHMVKIGMSPFDMSVASALFTQLVLVRGLMYSHAEWYGGDKHSRYLHWATRSDIECVGAQPNDVVVPQARYDEAERIWKDPVGWVQEELQKALAGQGQAARLGYGTATEYAHGDRG